MLVKKEEWGLKWRIAVEQIKQERGTSQRLENDCHPNTGQLQCPVSEMEEEEKEEEN